MSVRTGFQFLAIPGPTNVPDQVLEAMHQPAVDIYTGPLLDLTDRTLTDLKTVFKTSGKTYIYAANGHGAWEAALTNTLSRSDKILVLESGRFALGWGEMGQKLGLELEVLPGSWRHRVDANRLEERLRADTANEIKAILVVQIDTASSAQNDIAELRAAIDAAGHPALYMVDTIASLGTVDFRMDEWRVDVAVAGSQKGLMTPPGLSFVAASEKAKKAHETADLVTFYWDWTFREGPEHYQKYCGTPPEHLLFGQRKALDMILEEGLDNVFLRHELLCATVHRALETWADEGALSFNILDPTDRAQSVTTVLLDNSHDPQALRDVCERTFGVTLGSTIGDLNGKGFRIAHMGFVNGPMVLGTLGALEVSLRLRKIPHGAGGLQKAADRLADLLGKGAAYSASRKD